MKVKVDFTNKFDKQIIKAPLKIKKALRERLELFKDNPFYPLLKNHLLTGDYKGYRSINITGDWRAIYSEHEEGKLIIFESLGTHSQLYK